MTETKPVDNQILLSEIDKNLAVAGQESAVVPFIAALAKQLQRSAEQLLAAGDTWAVELESVGREELLPRSLAFYFHYQWVDGAKYFLVLWRNVLFENLKAHLLNMDGQLLTSQLRDLQHDSQEQLLAAKDELDQLWHSATQTAGSTAKSTRQQLESWFLQNHPWPVYRKQVETICTQAAGLLEQHRVLTHDSSYVQQIRKLVQETLEACENEVTVHLEMAVDGNNFLEDQENNKAAKVVIYIEQLESKIIQRKHSKHFTQQLDHQLHALTATTSIPVSSTGLTLQSKDINFQRHISRWLDSEILPLLYEVWEITIHVRNSLKMALINIRNRAIILKNEAVEAPTTANSRDDLKQALDIFRQQTQTRQGELAELQQHFSRKRTFSAHPPAVDLQPAAEQPERTPRQLPRLGGAAMATDQSLPVIGAAGRKPERGRENGALFAKPQYPGKKPSVYQYLFNQGLHWRILLGGQKSRATAGYSPHQALAPGLPGRGAADGQPLFRKVTFWRFDQQ
jgi:hypothetical protein